MGIDCDNVTLEEYYKNPVMESWTYVAMGMDNLKRYDLLAYEKIMATYNQLLPQINECFEYIKQGCQKLDLPYLQAQEYAEQFLQKFPLALRMRVGWDDPAFIFLYLLTRIIKPRVIIETGANIGFSSSFIALAIKENNNGCRFYTIEPCSEYTWESLSFVENNGSRQQKINCSKFGITYPPLGAVPKDLRQYIHLRSGISKDVLPRLLEENENVDIFFHDSDHSYKNMVWECMHALPQVRADGYILVHDIFQNSAFRQMFGNQGGVAIAENLGVYKKASEGIAINAEWAASTENAILNNIEYESKKIQLSSSPRVIVIQLDSLCKLRCAFCSEIKQEKNSSFDDFYWNIEGRISQYLSQADKIVFKMCGGFFDSLELKKMIHWRANCLEISFPEVEKVYYTNGMDLTPAVIDFIVNPRGCCSGYRVKNTLNIALYSSNSRLHKLLTGSDDFPEILRGVESVIKAKKEVSHLKVCLVFIATTLNIEDLPLFTKLASDVGADQVICSYNRISKQAHKYLSCFFKQEKTNEMLFQAEDAAKRLKIGITLPPKFNQKGYFTLTPCRKAWEQMTIDSNGNILTCDAGERCSENLTESNFMNSWNGAYYQKLRRDMLGNNSGCFAYCMEANPGAVNDFRSHVIHRGDRTSGINVLWGDNF